MFPLRPLLPALVFGAALWAAPRLTVDPYAGIDWVAFGQHKANFHTHTTESDGRLNPAQTIDEYHQRGYTILSITDHDRCTHPWQKWERDPAALGMVAVAGNELSRHHHTLNLFSDFETPNRDLVGVLGELAAHSERGLAVICHPAMHWPRQFGPPPGLHTELAPPLRQITRGDFTIETWFRTTKAGRNLLLGNFAAGGLAALNLELHTENRVRVYVQPPAGEGRTVDLNIPADSLGINTRDGQWHHLAGVRREGTVHLFLDGRLAGSREDTAGGFDLHGELYYLGRDTRTGSTILDGDLDQVRLWNRALSDAEVARQAAGGTVDSEGLLAHYAFETSRGVPVREGAPIETVVDDTANHPEGPFHATGSPTTQVWTIAETAAPLAAAGSTRAASFRPRIDLSQVPDDALAYYAELYENHDRLVGIEVLNGTRPLREYTLDRELWDKLLARLMPARPVWGLATDDMHSMTHLGRDWVVFPLADLGEEAIRQAMIRGAFYFSSTRVRGPEGAATEPPRIRRIAHDPARGTISVQADEQGEPLPDSAYLWIADGQTVHTGPVLDYRAVPGIAAYARLEIAGSGGTSYTNPFGFQR